jgi:peptide subunit release factor 1 (eRF1)
MGAIASRSSSEGRRSSAGRGRARTETPALHERLEALTAVRPGRHRVVTCYLKLEPRDRTRGKYLIKIKNRMRQALQSLPRLGLPRDVHDEVARDLGRIQEFLHDPDRLPTTHGVAVFACEGIDLFENVALPSVHRSRLAVDPTPLVRELASVEDEFGRLLTVVLDRTSARFFAVSAYATEELPGLRADATRGKKFHGGRPSFGEHTYHNRIREEKQRHYEAIARELFAIDRRQPARGIVLAASGGDAAVVEPFLHTYLAERVIGTAKLNPKGATAATVHAATLAVRERWERASERSLVDDMRESEGAGWAVNGVDETLVALARGQVRELLVNADAAEPGFRCGDSGRLARTEAECRGEGEAVAVLDIIDDAIEEALRQRLAINVIYEDQARASVRGLAALLRFR